MNKYGIDSFKILNFDTIDSTSTYFKDHFIEHDNLTIVFAKHQSSGHGRLERKWMATHNESILFSILIKDKKIIDNFAKLSLLSANVVFKLLSTYSSGISIKWPNDVYINDKKACGILLESKSINGVISALVLGIGININTSIFDDEIKDSATSLYLETNTKYDIEKLKEELLTHLKDGLNEIINDDNSYLDNVRKHNYLKDKEVYALINGNSVVSKVIDINDDNSLKVIYEDKIYNLTVGEVIKKS